MKETLLPGLTGRLEYTVPTDRTVPHLLPESEEFATMPEVLATGYLVGLLEWTSMRTLLGHLDEDEATLGVHIDISHDAPTPPGALVTVEAELTAVEGRSLTFTVQASDDLAMISRGSHRRAIITPSRFKARLRDRRHIS